MFDAVRNHKRIVQLFLLLITVPFALWGVDAYRNSGDAGSGVAKVGDAVIGQAEFRETLQAQQAELRKQIPHGMDASAILNSPELRAQALSGLIRQRLLAQEADRQHLRIDLQSLRSLIFQIPVFQENGKFSETRYRDVLAQNGLTPQGFEAQEMRGQQINYLFGTLTLSAFMPKTVADRLVDQLTEQRQVREFMLPWQEMQKKVSLTPVDVQAYYDSHREEFQQPEQVRVEYLTLENEPEQRRASHILLLTKEGEDPAKVRAQAEKLLAEVRKDPSRFAELAKEKSQDPGSAASGGDLGFFEPGMMVKPFSDAVFALKKGEISDLVQTDYGFHIIRLDDVKPGRFGDKPFAQVEEEFSDSAFNNADSLKPTAEAFKLEPRQSGWLKRDGAQGQGILDNPAFLASIFDPEVLQGGHNSKAVEVAPGIMVSARMLEHKPASVRPFAEVKEAIQAKLTETRALDLAAKEGLALLAKARAGEDKIAWGKESTLSRDQQPHMMPQSLAAIFKAEVKDKKLPVYTGVKLPGGYALYRIDKVTPGEVSAELREGLQQQLALQVGRTEASAYIEALRDRYPVKVNPAALKENRE